MSIRILVVEDDSRARSALHEYFSLCGLEVQSAGDASEAIAIGRRFRPRILLSDWRLGGPKDGVDVAKALTAAIEDLVILFMTGHSRENLGRLGAGLAIERIYPKPVSLSQLCADIELIAKR